MIKLAEVEVPDVVPGDGFDLARAIGIGRAREMMRGRGPVPRPPSRECLRRWITQGCPCGPGRVMLRLKARFISGEYLTMPGWVEAFEVERVRLSHLDPLEDEPTVRSRQAAKRRAARELDRAGIGTGKG